MFDYPLYLILGLLPSFIWLLFYLHKDAHPEPKRIVLKVFFWGALMGPAALLFQLGMRWLLAPTGDWLYFFATLNQRDFRFVLNILLFAPLVEEYLKYWVVKRLVLKNPAFDEPLDAMLYLVISALGFAAIENLLNILLSPALTPQLAFSQSTARFLSATLLHTLASGVLGYFLALSLLNFKKRRIIFTAGLFLAFVLHSLYNLLAWMIGTQNLWATVVTAVYLILMVGLVSWQFQLLKKQLSICKIKS